MESSKLKEWNFSLSTDVMKQNVSWETNSSFTPVSKQICSKAAQTDNIEDALSYLTAYEIIAKEMMITSHLLEHVAQRMIDALYNAFPQISHVTIKVSRLKPATRRKNRSHECHFIQINCSKVLQNPKYRLIFATQNRKRVGWPSG